MRSAPREERGRVGVEYRVGIHGGRLVEETRFNKRAAQEKKGEALKSN
jgi:hypothetical protein